MAGAKVNDLIGSADHARFVLDDQNGVTQVAQLLEDFDESVGVARVQSDAWFVEHIERVHQARAEASGQIHALGLAAGKGAGRTIQRKIAKTDLDEVGET